ncbi:hypothetical protein OIE66_30765 [Nonomuraea sp. NBC_01738]|uniref:hypothetical protein n=1 Tax=Nonomuraea sp. NBC_01738 TaxID=2976003 RepID=UPI002E0E4851|nr:hypothetical protein OIE66_30765 [Nonomuraea sp. NBC_01738]
MDVKRWLEGVQPRPATATFIAEALSRKAGVKFSLEDVGMGGVITPATLELGLEYTAAAPKVGSQLLGLTRRDLAEDPLAVEATVVPSAWTQPLLTWLLSRPEPLPAGNGIQVNVGDSDIRAVRMTTQLFMKLDFQFGGGHARAALAQYYVRDVSPLLEGKFTEAVGRELFSAAAEVAQLLGWTAYDLGRHGLAQRYMIQALRLAQAAGDRMLGGRLLGNMSHQANYLGSFQQSIQLARAAQEGSKGIASSTTMASFLAMEARAHAGNGDDRACSYAFREAEKIFDSRNIGDDPEWISYFDEAELAGEGAHCFRDLRKPLIAQEFAGHCLELTDPFYARTLSFIRLVQAATYVHQSEPCQAVALATEAIEIAGSLKSKRYLRYVSDLCTDLAEYRETHDVGRFLEMVATKYPAL